MFRSATKAALSSLLLLLAIVAVEGQSRIPAEQDLTTVAANNWLQVVGTPANGDPDTLMVAFFEIPDSETSTLYFGVRDPGTDGRSQAAGGFDLSGPLATPGVPDQDTTGSTSFSLVGGIGTISSSYSRLIYYTTISQAYTPATGAGVGTIASFSAGNVNDAAFTAPSYGWTYFAGVSPSQGEHIGNKYYFKVIAEASAAVGKNAFQLDVSYMNSGAPTGIAGVSAFAYAWTLALTQRTTPPNTWSLYPFVDDGATGNVAVHSWDMDNGEALAFEAKSGYPLGAPTVSVSAATWPTDVMTNVYSISTVETNSGQNQRNGTWKETVTENALPVGTDVNPAVFWASNSANTAWDGEAIDIPKRIYSAPYTPPDPDHVVIVPASQTLVTGGLANLDLQIVDSSGSPVPYSRKVYVQAPGGTIAPDVNPAATATAELITTDTSGLGTFTLTSAVAGTLNLTLTTDGGTNGSSSLPGAPGTASVTFVDDPGPKPSSVSNTSFQVSAASPQNLPNLTITDTVTSNIGTGFNLRVIIPGGLGAVFDNTVATVTVSGANAGTWNVTYVNGNKTAIIAVVGNPIALGTTVFAGLRLAGPFTASSGSLGISWTGSDTVADASDDKVITLAPTSYSWLSTAASSDWTVGANWAGGSAPPANNGTETVIIPTSNNYPILVAAQSIDIANLSIASGASITLGGGTSSLRIRGTFSNLGTLVIADNESLVLDSGNDLGSGTISYQATSGSRSIKNLAYFNLVLNGVGGTFTLPGPVSVAGNLSIVAGTLDAGANTLTVLGNFTRTGIFTPSTSTVIFAGSSPSTISGATTFHNLSCVTPGKYLYLTAPEATTVTNTLTIRGSAVSQVKLHGTSASASITQGTTTDVSHADISNVTIGSATAYYSTLSGTTTGWVSTSAKTWSGSTVSWNTASNWLPSGVPTASDDVIIPAMALQPVVDAAYTALANSLTIQSGAILDLSGNAGNGLTLSGAFSNDGILRLDGDETVIYTNDTNSGKVEYRGTGAYLAPLNGGNAYFDLSFLGAGGSWSLNAPITVSRNLALSAGTLSAGTNDVTVAGDVNLAGGTVFSQSGAGALVMQPASSANLNSGGLSLNNLAVNSAGTVTLSGSALSLGGNLVVTAGTLATGARGLTVGGSLTGGGTVTATTSSGVTVTGDLGLGTYNATSATTTVGGNFSPTVFAHGSGTLTFNGTGSAGTYSFNNVNITAGTRTATGPWTVAGALAASGGTWDISGQTINLATSADLTGLGTLTANATSLLNFDGGGAMSLTAATKSIPKVTLNAAGTLTLADAQTITTALTLSAGTLVPGTFTHQVAGNWDDSLVTFVPAAGTIQLTSATPTITQKATNRFFNLSLGNGGSQSSALVVNGALAVTGTLATGANPLSVGGSLTGLGTVTATTSSGVSVTGDLGLGTYNATSATTTVGGNFDVTNLTAPSGTIEFNGTSAAQSITPYGHSFAAVAMTGNKGVSLVGSASFASLSTLAGETFTLGGASTTALTVNGAYTNAGITDLSSAGAAAPTTLVMAGAASSITNTGTIQVSNSTGLVEVDGSGTTTTLAGGSTALSLNTRALTLKNFTTPVSHSIAGGETLSIVGTVTLGGLTNAGTLAFDSAAASTLALGNLTSTGIIANDAIRTSAINASGNVSITSPTFPNPTNNTLTMTGSGATLAVGALTTLGHLAVNSATQVVRAGANPLTLAGNLLVTGGSFDMKGLAVTMSGSQLRGSIVNTSAATSPAFKATAALSLAAATSISTVSGAGGGTITFQNSLDGAAGGETLDLYAGAGTVTFTGLVGNLNPPGAVVVHSDGGLVQSAAFSAASLTQSAGTGTDTLGANLTTSGALSLTTTGTINAAAITVSSGGGAQDYYGSLNLNAAGTFALNSGNGNVEFHGTVGAGALGRTLSVTAGAGTVKFDASVGSGTALGGLTVNSASAFTTLSTVLVDAAGNGADLRVDGTVSLGGTLTNSNASGDIQVQPVSPAADLLLANGTAIGSLGLDPASLANLRATRMLYLGSSSGTGAIRVGLDGGFTLNSNTTLRQLSTGNLAFNLAGANSMTMAAGLNLALALGSGTVAHSGSASNDLTLSGTGTLSITAASAGVSGTPLTASLTNLGTTNLVSGLYLTDTAALTVSGNIVSTNGPISLKGTGGLAANAGVTVNSNTGALTLDAGTNTMSLDATSTLNSTGSVTLRNASAIGLGIITGNPALIIGVGPDVTGAVTQNGASTIAVASLAASTSGAMTLTNANTIPAVGSLTTGGATQITTGGAMAVTGAVSTGANDVTLTATGITIAATAGISAPGANIHLSVTTGGVAQTAGAGILNASGLEVVSIGAIAASYSFPNANTISKLAANTQGGAFSFNSASALAVDSVTTPGITTNGNNLSLRASAGGLSVNQDIVAGPGSVYLDSGSGGISQNAVGFGKITTLAGLEVVGGSAGGFSLTNGANSLARLAVNTTLGAVDVYTLGNLSLDHVVNLANDGVTTGGANFTLTATGLVTQTKAVNLSTTGLLAIITKNNAGQSIDLSGATNAARYIDLQVQSGAGAATAAGNILYAGSAAPLTVNRLQAGTASGTVNLTLASGPIAIDQSGPITAGTSVTIAAGTNSVDFATNGSTNNLTAVHVTSAAALKLDSGAGYSLDGTASGAIDATTAAGDLTVTSSNLAAPGTSTINLHPFGNLVVNGTIVTGSGSITLQPGGTTALNAAVSSTTSGAIDVYGTTAILNVAAPTNLLSTSSANLRFHGPVVLAKNTLLTTGTGAGTVTFDSTVTGTLGTETLGINVGTGQVTFAGPVGGAGPSAIGALTVTGGAVGAPVTFSSTVALAAGASLGLTNTRNVIIGGAVTAPGGFSSSTGTGGGTFDNTGGTVTTTGSPIGITHAGNILIAAALASGAGDVTLSSSGAATTINLDAAITTGDGNVAIDATGLTTVAVGGGITTAKVTAGKGRVTFGATLAGGLSTAGNVTTQGSAITWTSPAALTGDVTLRATGGGVTDGAPISVVAVDDVLPATNSLTIVSSTTSASGTTALGGTIGSAAASRPRNLSITTNTALVLPTILLGGNLSIVSGTLTQLGGATLTIGGTTGLQTGGAAATLTNTGNTLTGNLTVTSAGNLAITTTGGNLTVAAVTSSGTINLDAATHTLSLAGAVSNGGSALGVTLTGDSLSLAGGSVAGGSAPVILLPSTATQAINLGTGGAALNLTSADLNAITTTGLLTIGGSGKQGAISISGAAVAPTNPSGGIRLYNGSGSGGIDVRESLTSVAGLALITDAAIARSTGVGTLTSDTGLLSLSAASGIGSIAGARPVVVDPKGSFTASNTGLNDLFVKTIGNVTLDAGFALTEQSGGQLRLDSGGNLGIAAPLSVAGAGSIALNAVGTITGSGNAVSAATVTLGANAATSIGLSGAPIWTAATTLLDATTTAGAIWVSNSGNVTVTAQANGGLLDLANTGTLTSGGAISSSAGINLVSSGDVSLGHAVTGTSGVAVQVTGAGGTISHTAGLVSGTNTTILLRADRMLLRAAPGTGTLGTAGSTVVIRPETTGRLIDLGSTTDLAAALELSTTELATVTGRLVIGDAAHTGPIAINAANATFPAGADPVRLENSGAGTLGGAGTLNAANLAFSIGSAVTLNSAVSTLAGSSGGGGLTVSNTKGTGLTVTNVDGIPDLGSSGQPLVLTENTGALTLDQPVNAGASTLTITLKGAGALLTQNAAITATGGLSLIADDMTLASAATVGASPVALTSYALGRGITLGTGTAGSLGLSSTELNTITSSGTLTIGDVLHTGTISTDGGVALTSLTGPVKLLTMGGNVTLGNSFATSTTPGSSLTLDATNGATTGVVSGAGQLTVGNGGNDALSVTAGAGINLGNTGNLANGVSLFNTTSGNVSFVNNITMTIAGSNAAAGGTFAVTNGNGTLTTSGALSTAGPGNADLSLASDAGLSLGHNVTVGGSGVLTLDATNSGGLAQGAGTIAATSVEVIGKGNFSLAQATNSIGTLAADTSSGSFAADYSGPMAIGTVKATIGVRVSGGALSLTTAAGSLSIGAAVSTAGGAADFSANLPSTLSAPISTGTGVGAGGALTFHGPVSLGANVVLDTAGTIGPNTPNTVHFISTLDGPFNLTVSKATTTTFTGAVGSTTALGDSGASAALSVAMGSTTITSTFRANQGISTLAVTFDDDVTILNGAGTAPTALSGNVTFARPTPQTFASARAVTLGALATDQITVTGPGSLNLSTTANNAPLVVNGKLDSSLGLVLGTNGSGALTLNAPVGSLGAIPLLTLNVYDLILAPSATVAATNLTANASGSAGWGATAGNLSLSDTETSQLTATTFTLASASASPSAILVDAVTSTTNLGTVVLSGTGAAGVAFSASASAFQALAVTAAGGITLTGGGVPSQISGTSLTFNSPLTQSAGAFALYASGIATFASTVTASGQKLSIYSGDIALGGIVDLGAAGTGELDLYTPGGGVAMGLGSTNPSLAPWYLDQTEIGRIQRAGMVRIGLAGAGGQSAPIYSTFARFSTGATALNAGDSAIHLATDGGAGAITLNDAGSAAANGALSISGAGTIDIHAGTGNLVAVAPNGLPEIQSGAGGVINLSSKGKIGAAGFPIQLMGGQGNINIVSPDGAPLGAWLEGIGGAITLDTIQTNGGALTLSVSGGGALRLATDITTSNDLVFAGPVILLNNISITNTGSGRKLEFQGTVDSGVVAPDGAVNGSPKNLTLAADAASGIVNLLAAAGTNPASLPGGALRPRLGALTISSAKDFLASSPIVASSLVQTSGSGGTTFDGSLDLNTAAGLQISTNVITINNTVATSSGGIVALDPSGSLALTSAATMNLSGAFTQGGAGTVSSAANITTAGATLAFGGPVTLTGNVLLSSGGGAVSFASTLRGTTADAQSLGITAGAGAVVFAGQVGTGALHLGALSIVSAGNFGGNLAATTAAAPIFALSLVQSAGTGTTRLGAVTATNNVDLTTGATVLVEGAIAAGTAGLRSTASTLTISAPISTSGAITIDSSGPATIAAAGVITVTGAAPVSFGATEAGTVTTAADISSAGGAIRYYRGVNLGGPVTLSGGAGSIQFDSSLNGAFPLTLNCSGSTTFASAVGGTTPLASLTTDAAGSTAINGGGVTTTGAQGYGDPVSLGASATFTSTGSGAITFGNTLNGAFALTVDSSGITTFGGLVGNTTPLASLATDAGTAGSTAVNGGGISTIGTQSYGDDVNLAILDATFASAGGGAGGAITFAKALNGARAATVHTSGPTTFAGPVGGTTALVSLTTDAAGTTAINGGLVATAGLQAYNDDLTLGADAVFASTGSGAITFAKTLNGGFAASVNTSGITTFAGAVGGTTALASLTTDMGAAGSTAIDGGSLKTTGAQTFGDTVTVGADLLLSGASLAAQSPFLDAAASTHVLTLNFSGALSFAAGLGDAGTAYPFARVLVKSASSLSLGAGRKITSDLFVDAPGSTISLLSAVTLSKSLYFYRGTLNVAGMSLDAEQDLVAFGSAFDSVDHDWTSVAGNSRHDFFGRAGLEARVAGVPTGAAAGQAAFGDLAGSTIVVGRSLYVNGASLLGTAPWTLTIPDNSGSHPVFNNSGAVTADQWGLPTYAVAFNLSVQNSTATGGVVAAASALPAVPETNQNVVAVGANPGWQFARPEISVAATAYDDIMKVTFSLPVENSNDEIRAAVIAATAAASQGGAWYNSGSPIQLRGVYFDSAATIATTGQGDLSAIYLRIDQPDPTYRWNTDATGSSAGAADSTDRGRAALAPSHRTRVPDLSFLKGLFSAAAGKTLARGYNTNSAALYAATLDGCGPVLIAVRTGQETHLAPASGQQAFDAHNYFELRWSEPVDLGDLVRGVDTPNVRSQPTFSGLTEHGGHYEGTGTDPATSVATLAGYFSVGGVAVSGASIGIDTTLASPTTSATQSSSSLYRSAANPAGLRVYLAGFAEDARSLNPAWTWYWPGWYDALTLPSGAVTVPLNPGIRDAAGNTVEGSADSYAKYPILVNDAGVLSPNGGANLTDLPVVLASSAQTDGGWDVYQPTFALARSKTDWSVLSGEIVPLDFDNNTRIDRLEFHLLDNADFPLTSATPPDDLTLRWASIRGWIDDSVTSGFETATSFFDLPDTRGGSRPQRYSGGPVAVPAQTGGGIRDSTLNNVALSHFAAKDGNAAATPYDSSHNSAFKTYVTTPLFSGGGSVDLADDPYFALVLRDTDPGYAWTGSSSLYLSYDANGNVTDLAGNRLHTVTDLKLVQRVPPRFRLALSIADSAASKLYLKFSKPVNIDSVGGTLGLVDPLTNLANVFSFSDPTLTVTGASAIAGSTSRDEVMLTLSRSPTAADILGVTFGTKNVSATDPITGESISGSFIIDDSGTPLSPTETHRLSDLGLNVVQVNAATDGVHDTADPVLGTGQTATPTGALGALRDFGGSGRLLDRDITVYTSLEGSLLGSPASTLPIQLFYDVAPASFYAPFVPITGRDPSLPLAWLPGILPGFNDKADSEARAVTAFVNPGLSGLARDFRIPGNDSEMKAGAKVGFLVSLGGLYCLRASDPDDPRQFDLFRFGIEDVKTQRGGVTILSNVIDPTKGERTALQIVLPQAGTLTVSIFTLDGDLVRRVYNDRQAAGTYTYFWDGRNASGEAVARGVYFVRVVAQGIDEIRKVLVVR